MHRLASSLSVFAGLCILFQLRLMWGLWRRDITFGDTSSYFFRAVDWYANWGVDLVWSPLYTSFYGSLLYLSQDAHLVTILHRLLAALAVSGLVGAIAWRLLPLPAAWVVAAWWVRQPIGFETLYEVHLFSAILPLVAWLVSLGPESAARRAAVLSILVACTLLQRNEYLIATAIMAAVCLVKEVRSRPRRVAPYVAALTVPILLVTFYAIRSPYPNLHEVRRSAAVKHTLNVCQIYAFGYQQRNPGYTDSPWVHCGKLMKKEFGSDSLTFTEAAIRNPAAISDHILWNAKLIPAGIELLLFSRTGFLTSPDYVPIVQDRFAHVEFAVCLLILAAGAVVIARDWTSYWRQRASAHSLGLWMAFAIAVTSTAVMLMQRPRPSYLLPLSVVIMVAVLIAACAVLRGTVIGKLAMRPYPVALLIAAAFLLTPVYYTYDRFPYRSLREIVARTWPHRHQLPGKQVTLLTQQFPVEACSYIFRGDRTCTALSFITGFWPLMQKGTPLSSLINDYRPNVFFVDETLMEYSSVQEWLVTAPEAGWQRVASGPRWALLKNDWTPGSRQLVVPDP